MNQLKILFFFVFAFLFCPTEQAVRACKTEILRSFGLHSNVRATKGSGLCPAIRYNCCTKFDEMKLHKLWNTFTLRRIEMRHKTAQLMITKLNSFVGIYGGIDIPKMILDYEKNSPHKHPEKLKEHITKLTQFFLSNTPKKFLANVKLMQKVMVRYYKGIVKIRGDLNCSLCNWDNHKFIDVVDKQMILQGKFCIRMAQVLIDPVAQKYLKIFRLILAFDEFIYLMYSRHLIEDDFERKKLQRNLALTQSCANSPSLKSCAEFCGDINFNKFTWLLDGEVGVIKRMLDNIDKLQQRMSKDPLSLFKENFIKWEAPLVSQIIKKSVINSDFGVNLKVPLEEKDIDDPKDIKLRLNLTKITKVIFKDHIHHPLQLESLDSEIDSITLYKIKEHPIDMGEIKADIKMFGINPIRDGNKSALYTSIHVFLARLHHGTHDTHSIDEEIDKRLMKVLANHQLDDFANYQNDNPNKKL